MVSADLQIAELTRAMQGASNVYAVHYACESFYEPLDHPPVISAISVSTVPPGEDETFSLVDTRGDEAEVRLLERFYSWLQSKPDARLVHWNMNKTEYGFGAIAKRFTYITDQAPPTAHSQERLFDLDELIRYRHGPDYASHPRLSSLVALNGITTRYSLTGAEQAQRFAAGAHADLARCTAERARDIAELANRFVAGTLQTARSGPAVRFAGVAVDSVETVVALGERLREAASELSRRRTGKPLLQLVDEYDYQDFLRSVLRIFFDDVRPEDVAPKVAGGTSRIDFFLPEVGLAVELKAARDSLTSKRIGEELIVDTRRYQSHAGVLHLICLVFDPEGLLENPRGLEADLSGARDGLGVTVRIYR
jgi:hypothetical protein